MAFARIFIPAGISLLLTLLFCSDTPKGWSNYSRPEGAPLLADMAVQDMCQSGKSTWFALSEAVSRFDGEHWTTYGVREGVPGKVVWGVSSQGDSIVWIAAEDGVAAWRNHGGFFRDSVANRGLRDAITAVAWKRSLLIGTAHGLYEATPHWTLEGLHLRSVEPILLPGLDGANKPNVRAIVSDPGGNGIWVATYSGVCKLPDSGEGYMVTSESGLPSNMVYGMAPVKDNLWVATSEGVGILSPAGEVVSILDTTQGLSNSVSTCMEKLKKTIWIGTLDGLNGYNPENGSVKVLGKQDGLANNAIRCLLANKNELWVGFLIGGVSRHRGVLE